MLTSAAAIMLMLAPIGSGQAGQHDVFRAAAYAPRDVTMFVHVADAAGVARELAGRPLARVGRQVLERGQIREAWRGMARATGLDGDALMRNCLGGELTILGRTRGQVSEWAVISDLGPVRAANLMGRLGAVNVRSRFGTAVCEVPGQRTLIGKRGGVLVVGPTDQAGLFDEVLKRLDSEDTPGLLESPAVKKASAELGLGRIGLLFRHDEPLGGWSAAVVTLHEDQIGVRLESQFEHSPFTRPRTAIKWDASTIEVLEEHALVVIGEPTDVGESFVDQGIRQVVGRGLIDDEMSRHVGPRRFLAVGEQEMRLAEQPVNLLAPTFTMCVEVNDRHTARVELDRAMNRFVHGLNEFSRHLFSIDATADSGPGAGRVDLAPFVSRCFDQTPLVGEVTLNWTVAEGPGGTFCLISSHPQPLNEIRGALRKMPAAGGQRQHSYDSVGAFNGMRLAKMLRSWGDQAAALATPGAETELRDALDVLSALAGGIDRCCWQLERPSDQAVALQLQIRLAPPESSHGE